MVKTEEQEAIWGGTAGEQFDPCYHLACDTFENVESARARRQQRLIAFAMLTFAYSTESGQRRSRQEVRVPPLNLPPPAGPEGTFATDGGGGPGPVGS